MRFQGPDFRAFDDNRDDNRDFFDDNRPDDSSSTCSNRAPIESKASRCTASITSTYVPVVTVIELCRRIRCTVAGGTPIV
jgi:hypothetical protein